MARWLPLVACVLLWPAVSPAQSGQPGAPVADPFIARPDTYAPRPDASDQFLAGPETYAPRYDRAGRGRTRGPHPEGRLFFPDVWYAPLGFAPYPTVERREAEPAPVPEKRDPVVTRPPDDRLTNTPPAPAVPTVPKTFYVIRGCYAGDRLPRQDVLPDGCRVEDVMTMESR